MKIASFIVADGLDSMGEIYINIDAISHFFESVIDHTTMIVTASGEEIEVLGLPEDVLREINGEPKGRTALRKKDLGNKTAGGAA